MTEADSIKRIASRTIALLDEHAEGHRVGYFDTVRDIQAVHNLITPLRLAELAEARDTDLLHDVLGIRQNLNREDFRLVNFFHPRFAAQQ